MADDSILTQIFGAGVDVYADAIKKSDARGQRLKEIKFQNNLNQGIASLDMNNPKYLEDLDVIKNRSLQSDDPEMNQLGAPIAESIVGQHKVKYEEFKKNKLRQEGLGEYQKSFDNLDAELTNHASQGNLTEYSKSHSKLGDLLNDSAKHEYITPKQAEDQLFDSSKKHIGELAIGKRFRNPDYKLDEDKEIKNLLSPSEYNLLSGKLSLLDTKRDLQSRAKRTTHEKQLKDNINKVSNGEDTNLINTGLFNEIISPKERETALAFNKFANLSYDDKQKQLSTIKDPEEKKQYQQVINYNKAHRSLDRAIRRGIVDLNPINTDDPRSLIDRDHDIEVYKSVDGLDYAPYFTREEKQVNDDLFTKGSLDQRVNAINALSNHENAYKSMIRDGKDAVEYAGILSKNAKLLNGISKDLIEHILVGDQIRKDNKSNDAFKQSTINLYLTDSLPLGLLAKDPDSRKNDTNIRKMIGDYYSSYSDVDDEGIDEDSLKIRAKELIGEPIDIPNLSRIDYLKEHTFWDKKHQILPPKPNMSTEDVKHWIDGLSNNDIDNQYSENDKNTLLNMLKKGTLTLKSSGIGEYYLIKQDGTYVTNTKTKKPFVLNYNYGR